MDTLASPPAADFAGLRVVAFESRMAGATEGLIRARGGNPLVAPSMREAPLSENAEALDFAEALFSGRVDIVIFLTGVGVRVLTKVIETRYAREKWVEALSRVTVAARGPKPIRALWELGVPVDIKASEPHTWREVLAALDAARELMGVSLGGCQVAVQEYGATNKALLDGLRDRGATTRRAPVYQWALPDDTRPLCSAIAAIADGNTEVVLFTTSVQVVHMFQMAREMGREAALRAALTQTVIGSIGPTTTETLMEHGLAPDLEPAHPRLAALVKEAAGRSHALLAAKRALEK